MRVQYHLILLPATRIIVFVRQAMWNDIKTLGHLVRPYACVFVVGRYQKFDGVHKKK